MLHHNYSTANNSCGAPSSSDAASSQNNGAVLPKRKRRPAGTPDPDAEVVCLSPKTLLESDRYVCEICKQGFQREQNLQMHRRRHKVPWRLVKKETQTSGSGCGSSATTTQDQQVKKKVFVCPEPTCLHHNPCHALGDLVGIKKHFRRKHSNHKQWVCHKCSKAYAVQSDYKAHLKTCGTRGHSCDCGRVFSRVESFIEHQDACSVRTLQGDQSQQVGQPASCSRTASSTSPSSDANLSIVALAPLLQGLPLTRPPPPPPPPPPTPTPTTTSSDHHHHHPHKHNILEELQLLRCSSSDGGGNRGGDDDQEEEDKHETETHLKLSIGSSSNKKKNNNNNRSVVEVGWLKECASEELKLAMEERAYAEEARREAKREIEMAEVEFVKAKRLRREAQEELQRAEALKKQAMMKMNSTLLDITCQACKQHFQSSNVVGVSSEDTSSIVMSYISSPTTEGEGE